METESEGAEAGHPVEMETSTGMETCPEITRDHSYCKLLSSDAEPMETDKLQAPAESHGTVLPKLTLLDQTHDNFESLLLLLLQAYTTQNCPGNPSILGGAPISGEALDTLSAEQITALITSNSVNYEVIQQILAQQKGRPSVAGRLNSPLQEQNRSLTLGEEVQEDPSKSPTPLHSPVSSEMQQLVQITPKQLDVLQSQVNELLQSQHISLPPDLSPEQQQQLIQTLLLRQLQIQQSGGAISMKDASQSMSQLLSASEQVKPALVTAGRAAKEGSDESGVHSDSGNGSSAKAAQSKVISTSKPTSLSGMAKSTSLSGAAVSAMGQSGVGRGRGKRTATKSSGGRGGARSTGAGQKKKDSPQATEPKKHSNAYQLFFSEVYSTVIATNPKMGFSDASRIISTMWTAMGSDVKQRYYDEHERLKAKQEEEREDKTREAGTEKYSCLKSLITAPGFSTVPKPAPSLPSTPVVTMENPIVATARETQTTSVVTTDIQNASAYEATKKNIPITGQVTVKNSVSKQSTPVIDYCTDKDKDPNLCVNQDCKNAAIFVEDRGPRYCSNECVMTHCRKVFDGHFIGKKVQA